MRPHIRDRNYMLPLLLAGNRKEPFRIVSELVERWRMTGAPVEVSADSYSRRNRQRIVAVDLDTAIALEEEPTARPPMSVAVHQQHAFVAWRDLKCQAWRMRRRQSPQRDNSFLLSVCSWQLDQSKEPLFIPKDRHNGHFRHANSAYPPVGKARSEPSNFGKAFKPLPATSSANRNRLAALPKIYFPSADFRLRHRSLILVGARVRKLSLDEATLRAL
ncbi:hypothetical protein MFFC18_17640 [Mariniblastus fucicola]|uniref:Uncharacterized protein n=1 Tax=Mariniblastus fucicola TaxID=980251 RepID=A0A5B9PGL9_9BACT|nr:hypothetical protein MFFC18_17640 [Mariniblastus fucicola]